MAGSGIRHVVTDVPVPKSAYEDEAHHALIHGTGFPAGPVEKQLYYRDDLHKWYIYNGSSWVETTSQGVTVHNDLTGRDAAGCHPFSAISSKVLNGLDDVNAPSPTDGQVLYRDAGTSKWKAQKVKGSNLSQVFGASGKKLLNFVPYTSDNYLLYLSLVGDSSFVAKINGAPAGATVVYDTVTGNEESITGEAADEGHLVLHNITRGDSALIDSVDTGTNTITLTDTHPATWDDDDDIQVNSLTALAGASPYYFDLDISGVVPSTCAFIYLDVAVMDSVVNKEGVIHPYEAIGADKNKKAQKVRVYEASTFCYRTIIVAVTSQKVCILFDASGVNTLYFVLRCFGWWEEAAT